VFICVWIVDPGGGVSSASERQVRHVPLVFPGVVVQCCWFVALVVGVVGWRGFWWLMFVNVLGGCRRTSVSLVVGGFVWFWRTVEGAGGCRGVFV